MMVLALAGPARAADEVRIGSLAVTGAWVRAMPDEARQTEAFAPIRNLGAEPDRLLSASSPAARVIRIVDPDATAVLGVAEGLSVPAAGTRAMEPNGTHLQLVGVSERLRPGAAIRLTLRFERAGEVTLELRAHDH